MDSCFYLQISKVARNVSSGEFVFSIYSTNLTSGSVTERAK